LSTFNSKTQNYECGQEKIRPLASAFSALAVCAGYFNSPASFGFDNFPAPMALGQGQKDYSGITTDFLSDLQHARSEG
jgi:hypothetical protein